MSFTLSQFVTMCRASMAAHVDWHRGSIKTLGASCLRAISQPRKPRWSATGRVRFSFKDCTNYVQKESWSLRRVKDTTLENNLLRASLVVQWLTVCLPMQGTQVQALVREDPTCCGATKPVCHNYWACALEPASHNYWARVPQLLKPVSLEPVLHNKWGHHDEKPARHNEE